MFGILIKIFAVVFIFVLVMFLHRRNVKQRFLGVVYEVVRPGCIRVVCFGHIKWVMKQIKKSFKVKIDQKDDFVFWISDGDLYKVQEFLNDKKAWSIKKIKTLGYFSWTIYTPAVKLCLHPWSPDIEVSASQASSGINTRKSFGYLSCLGKNKSIKRLSSFLSRVLNSHN